LHVFAPDPVIRRGIAVQQRQLVQVEMRRQQVAPPEVENSAMARLAALPIGLDHAHVFVLNALAARGADHSQEHGLLRNLSLSKPT
jgi:hypothetical protein